MKKKTSILVIITIALISIGTVYAAAIALSAHYSIPQTATAPIGVSASFTINGQAWTNGTSISWGQLQLGTNTMPLTVTNTGSVVIATVTITNTGLPNGWTETITMGTPIGSTIPGTITLNADASVIGTQTWTSTITLTSP
jgi:hypothetical protein